MTAQNMTARCAACPKRALSLLVRYCRLHITSEPDRLCPFEKCGKVVSDGVFCGRHTCFLCPRRVWCKDGLVRDSERCYYHSRRRCNWEGCDESANDFVCHYHKGETCKEQLRRYEFFGEDFSLWESCEGKSLCGWEGCDNLTGGAYCSEHKCYACSKPREGKEHFFCERHNVRAKRTVEPSTPLGSTFCDTCLPPRPRGVC